jgi:hypothetical protein
VEISADTKCPISARLYPEILWAPQVFTDDASAMAQTKYKAAVLQMKMKRKNEDQLPSSITDLDIEKCGPNLLVPVLPQVVFCSSICDCGTWMQFGTPVLDACSHSSAAKFLGSTSGRNFFFLTSGWNGS